MELYTEMVSLGPGKMCWIAYGDEVLNYAINKFR